MENRKIENLTEKEKLEIIREQKNLYQKEWYGKNRAKGIDKQKEYQERYWLRKAGVQV